ncbi:MAG: hypothetical protein FWE53_04795, partial [Firmicutes bacterium]|nr:hypothetical protein [Bacillota bacterium]
MKKILTLCASFALMLACAVTFAACGGGATDLVMSTVTVNTAKASVSWTAVTNAANYTVKVGDETFTVTGTSFALPGKVDAGSYQVQVRANTSNAEKYNTSAYSAAKTVDVKISVVDGVVTWTEIEGTEVYNVYLCSYASSPSETGIVDELPAGFTSVNSGDINSGNDLELDFTSSLTAGTWYVVEILSEEVEGV